MDDFVIIKSKEDIEDLFLYLKKYLKDNYNKKDAVKYKNISYNKIYIKKDSLNIAIEAIADFLINNYAFFFSQEYFDDLYNDAPFFNALVSSIKSWNNGKIPNIIRDDIGEFINTFQEINISSYIFFSFRKFEELINKAINCVISRYNTEEEYNRILSLMSEYLNDLSSKADTIHIVSQTNGTYIYLDNDLNNIRNLYAKTIKEDLGEGEHTIEDEILCLLINLKPKKINLHLKYCKPNINFLYTLEAIFGDKIRICSNGCEICEP